MKNSIFFIIMLISALSILSFMPGDALAESDKTEMNEYIKTLTSTITETDIMLRNVSLNHMAMPYSADRIEIFIKELKGIDPPDMFRREHKMVLLSFMKIRLGLKIFSVEDRIQSVRLIKGGAMILKKAAQDIVAIAREEGIIDKKEVKSE